MRVLLASFHPVALAPVAFTESLVGLFQRTSYSVTYKPFVRIPIHVARRRAADDALAGDFDRLVMVDDDHSFSPDALDRLLVHDVDVVSALAFQRLPPHEPCTFMWAVGDQVLHYDYTARGDSRGLTRVDAVGFPFAAIKTDVLRKLDGDWFGHWRAKDNSSECGEDVYFSARCRDAGIPIHCDTSLVVPHFGSAQIVTEETYRAHKQETIARALRAGGIH